MSVAERINGCNDQKERQSTIEEVLAQLAIGSEAASYYLTALRALLRATGQLDNCLVNRRADGGIDSMTMLFHSKKGHETVEIKISKEG